VTEGLFLLGGEDPLDAVVEELRKLPGWPADDVRDREFVAELARKYPGMVLSEEAYAWRTWMLDHKQKKEVKPRARFVTWVRNSADFRRDREAARKDRKNTGRASRTAPARPEQFGEQSSQSLSGW
jgi:hypothetical protein